MYTVQRDPNLDYLGGLGVLQGDPNLDYLSGLGEQGDPNLEYLGWLSVQGDLDSVLSSPEYNKINKNTVIEPVQKCFRFGRDELIYLSTNNCPFSKVL